MTVKEILMRDIEQLMQTKFDEKQREMKIVPLVKFKSKQENL